MSKAQQTVDLFISHLYSQGYVVCQQGGHQKTPMNVDEYAKLKREFFSTAEDDYERGRQARMDGRPALSGESSQFYEGFAYQYEKEEKNANK